MSLSWSPMIARSAEQLEVVPGLVLPVASTGHLIALKLLARDDVTRPQDLADLRALLTVAKPADVEVARHAVQLITDRGFNRERNLLDALDSLIASFDG
ncbi:MAG TPA: nucleotidyl transferase AbiEii/AbiGii toxin family protein [Pseudonocardiaceae bacterium]